MIELYHSTHSTCSQKVRLCLAEKGLAWRGHHLNLRRFDHLQSEFLALNPAGMVPVLKDQGRLLTESRLINEYLEDAYPQVRLTPADLFERVRMREWTKYADEVPSEAVKLPSFVKNIQPELQALPRDVVLAKVAAIPDPHVRERWRKAACEGIATEELRPSIERLEEMIERMDRALSHGPWLSGGQFSLADVDIAPFVQRLVRIDLFHLVEQSPRVADWYARISARPAYQLAMPSAGSEGVQPA